MSRTSYRSRWVAAAVAVLLVPALLSCDHTKEQLLEPQNPGLVDPDALTNPTAANALRVGALSRYRQVVVANGNESIWQMGGVLTDEFKNSDFLTDRVDVDRRTVNPQNVWGYSAVTQSRGYVRDAILAMQQYLPKNVADIGELYVELGFFELTLAENFCNGIPLGHTLAGEQTLGTPLTTAEVFDSALVHADSALAINTATDAAAVFAR